MQSIIVLSKNKLALEEYVENLCKEYGISNFDFSTTESETTIGIEEVRIIQKNLLLRPGNGNIKAILLKTSGTIITPQGQNALLKILEEPPEHTLIIITASSEESLLPTIISRCKIIQLQKESSDSLQTDSTLYMNILESFPSLSLGSRLKLAQDVSKTKEEALGWVEKMIRALRENILMRSANQYDHALSDYLTILISLNKTYTILSTTNVNPRFTLEHLLLNL